MVCLGFEPWCSSMVGADDSTELWRHPLYNVKHNDVCLAVKLGRTVAHKKEAV